MFGYVLPRRDKLSEAENDRYRAAYCGLCRCLKERYGFRARFLVNYDMTFLYFLLQEGQAKQPERCFCPAKPFCKKDCLPPDGVMDYAADMTVLLSCWKLRDARHDDGFFKRMAAGFCLRLYKRAFQKASAARGKENCVFAEQLARLSSLEEQRCESIDRAADAFATLLKACAGYHADENLRRMKELLLYHVGRFLYLTDALEDLPKDNRTGAYNPLRYRYRLQDGALTQADREQFMETVDASISMAASALELLPETADRAILHNIIYNGLPAVLHSVADGSFRKRGTGK
ncbi:MAG: hypothetical protein IJG45_05510 [Oscillospiraceae bacterium]|nr:hypothetical protein [Oscillospiraceae bacterium]